MVSTLCAEVRRSSGETASARTEKAASILIVEDDSSYRKALAKMFAKAGYVVAAAPDAHMAIRLLETRSVDVVLTDLKMPGKDGLNLARALRDRWLGLKVITMTAYGTRDSYLEAKALGVAGFLLKPLSREYLLGTVEKVLGRRAGPAMGPLKVGDGDETSAGSDDRCGAADGSSSDGWSGPGDGRWWP